MNRVVIYKNAKIDLGDLNAAHLETISMCATRCGLPEGVGVAVVNVAFGWNVPPVVIDVFTDTADFNYNGFLAYCQATFGPVEVAVVPTHHPMPNLRVAKKG